MSIDLIKRIEAADGPSRELDRAIYVRINGPDRDMEKVIARGGFNYTSSIDAAMTLVPPERRPMLIQQPCGKWSCGMLTLGDAATAISDDRYDQGVVEGIITPALALCAAALKARSK